METNVNYTIVGAFVITLITFIILGVIWLSAGFSTETYRTYQVYMKESVSGLSKNAPVEYNGVVVGNVTSIKINTQNPQYVELLLKIKEATPITLGTTAKLDSKTLSGVAFILLEDKGENLTKLTAKPGQPYPVIATVPSFYRRLSEFLNEINTNFHEMSDSFQQIGESIALLLDEENLAALKQSLKNFREFTGSLAKNKHKISTFLQHSSGAAQILETKTLPAANDAIANFNSLGRNLNDVTEEVKQNPAVLIRGKQPAALGPGEH